MASTASTQRDIAAAQDDRNASALTAEDSTVIDATYGADEEGVLNNVRTRVGEIETALQRLGLVS